MEKQSRYQRYQQPWLQQQQQPPLWSLPLPLPQQQQLQQQLQQQQQQQPQQQQQQPAGGSSDITPAVGSTITVVGVSQLTVPTSLSPTDAVPGQIAAAAGAASAAAAAVAGIAPHDTFGVSGGGVRATLVGLAAFDELRRLGIDVDPKMTYGISGGAWSVAVNEMEKGEAFQNAKQYVQEAAERSWYEKMLFLKPKKVIGTSFFGEHIKMHIPKLSSFTMQIRRSFFPLYPLTTKTPFSLSFALFLPYFRLCLCYFDPY
jgi:hypothetical protein